MILEASGFHPDRLETLVEGLADPGSDKGTDVGTGLEVKFDRTVWCPARFRRGIEARVGD